MKRIIVLAGLVLAGVLSIVGVQAQQNAAAMRVENIKDTLYHMTGGRDLGAQANGVAGTTLFIAGSGVVLIDTKHPGLGKAVPDQVKSVTSKPITTSGDERRSESGCRLKPARRRALDRDAHHIVVGDGRFREASKEPTAYRARGELRSWERFDRRDDLRAWLAGVAVLGPVHATARSVA